MTNGKVLVAYYSRNNHTKKVAMDIAKKLNADLDQIIDIKDRSGITGWLGAGKDAFFRNTTIISVHKAPEKYDKVIIGTPVWAGRPTPAIREYLKKALPEKVAFFCTFGGDPTNAIMEMGTLSKKKPLATLGVMDKKIMSSEEEIDKFCKKVK
jgi:flavodoxin